MPNLGRAWGEPSLLPFGCRLVCLQLGQIRVANTAIHHHLLHSHRFRSRPDQIQNPNSKRAVWILDFWILGQFSLRSFCGAPKRRRLDFGVWILGLDEASTDIVWILHKIFPCHADSGRRISPGVMFGNSPGVMFGLVSHFMTPVFSRWMWENLQIPTSGEDCFPGCFRHFRMVPQKLLGCFWVSKLLKKNCFQSVRGLIFFFVFLF